MRIVKRYSHLNGEEFLLVHRPDLWQEVQDVVAGVDAETHRTKISREKTTFGKLLYSPVGLNRAFGEQFKARGWKERRQAFWVTSDEQILRGVVGMPPEAQKAAIEESGQKPIHSYNQTDYIKDRVAVEVQLGKYSFVAHDVFVKHMAFFVSDLIDVGIEIVPMKELESEMSSGVAYYERDLMNILRQGRGVPAVPLVLVGIAP
ncbi:MAG: restriction endonuclease [Gammaproteobacteria bacterium]|nr:restriction endonuclease [Gammaproteobacteria bacterium]